MADGVKTAQGSDSWHDSVVWKMLQDEKYIGDALLQKTFMADIHAAVIAAMNELFHAQTAREALEQTTGTITEFDEVTVRQLVSNIKVVSENTLLICFKDGTEIIRTVEDTGRASA